MTETDIVGLVVLATLFVPGLILWQWQQVALNDVQDRKEAGKEQLLGWSYQRWRGRLSWSLRAIVRYRQAMRKQLGSPSGPHQARHAATRAEARQTARRRSWWWLLPLPAYLLAGVILARVAGLPVPRLFLVASAVATVGVLVGVVFFLAKSRNVSHRDHD